VSAPKAKGTKGSKEERLGLKFNGASSTACLGGPPHFMIRRIAPEASFEGLGKPIWRLGSPISRMRLKYGS